MMSTSQSVLESPLMTAAIPDNVVQASSTVEDRRAGARRTAARRQALRQQQLLASQTKSANGALEPIEVSSGVTSERAPKAGRSGKAKSAATKNGGSKPAAPATSTKWQSKHVTERWPPTKEQLDNFISNMLPDDASDSVAAVKQWYEERFQTAPKPRTRNLSARFTFEPAKLGSSSGDRLEFIIAKDHRQRTENLAAKETLKGLYNVHLLRYFVEEVWKLPRPDVIISVTGGAMAFDLPSVHKDMIMKGRRMSPCPFFYCTLLTRAPCPAPPARRLSPRA
jgi:hypothetical protein